MIKTEIGQSGMWILALDGALARCSAAVRAEGRLVAHAAETAERGHASLLPPLVQRVLREAGGITAPQLDAVAVGVGPGGFTGLRAALALAQGIALAAGLPLVGVTTGEALLAGLPPVERQGRTVWTAVDTKRGRVVLERFATDAEVPEGPPEAFELTALPATSLRGGAPLAVAGDAAPAVVAALAALGVEAQLATLRLPDAAAVTCVAARRLAGRLPPREAAPLYVEPPAVRLPSPPSLVRTASA
jgi:tRNA threonylcarbamoyladenosine biosynthesis protein TsaB